MAHVKIGKGDLVWSYVGTFFKVSTNVLLLPIIISYLTESEVGLWYVFASISQFVILFDFGFAPSFARNIAYVWSGAKTLKREALVSIKNDETDWTEFYIILRSCKYVYLLISSLALLLLLSFGSFYIIKVASISYIYAWIVYSIAVFLNLLYSYYTSFLRGIGAVAENNKSGTISKIVQLVFCWLLLELEFGLLGVSIAYLLSGIALRASSKIYFYKYENIGRNIRGIVVDSILNKCIDRFKIIWHNSSREGLVTISNYLNSQANTLICSYMIGLSATGSYGVSLQIATLVSTVASIPFSAYQPQMQENAISNNIEKNRKLLSFSIVSFVIAFIVLAICSLLSVPIIHYIKPNFELDINMYLLILLQIFLWAFYGLFCSFISSYNQLPYTKTYIVSSFITVILTICMVKYSHMGIWALIVSPIIVSLYNVWKWPNYVKKYYLHTSFCQMLVIGVKELFEISKSSIRNIFSRVKH